MESGIRLKAQGIVHNRITKVLLTVPEEEPEEEADTEKGKEKDRDKGKDQSPSKEEDGDIHNDND